MKNNLKVTDEPVSASLFILLFIYNNR